MIVLSIEEYCHNCPNFSVEQNTDIMRCGFDTVAMRHTITCKSKGTCTALVAYLKEEKKNEKNNDRN